MNAKSEDLCNYYFGSDDVVVEEEKIVYLTDNLKNMNTGPGNITEKFVNIDLSKTNISLSDSDDKDVIIEEEIIVYNDNFNQSSQITNIDFEPLLNSKLDNVNENNFEKDDLQFTQGNSSTNRHKKWQEKKRYKRKYLKVDPNIIIEFASEESNLLKAIKILFDWLKVNNQVLINCFATNPEFIHKIIKLLNYLNIDIFTNKVFFDSSLINISGIRENVRSLFDCVSTMPIHEDHLLKHFSILNDIQIHLNWAAKNKLNINVNEQNFLRVLKLVDFGFFMCKTKKLGYNFCALSRLFTETANKQRDRNFMQKKFLDKKKKIKGRPKIKTEQPLNNKIKPFEAGLLEEQEHFKSSIRKKSYLKNRNYVTQLAEKENLSLTENKYEIMGKLWLRNEVRTLETKIKKPISMTPYLVMDSKSLTAYSSVIKCLINTGEFIILIPTAGKYFFIYNYI